MKNIELNANENIIDYIIEHSEELKNSRILLTGVDLSKYGFIESKKCDVIRPKKKLIDNFRKPSNEDDVYIIEYEYFLHNRKDVSMLVRETSSVGPWLPKTRELLTVFKNHDYTKTLFSTPNMDAFDAMFLAGLKVKQSNFLTSDVFAIAKKDCVSDFIIRNKEKFENKTIIIPESALKDKYLGFSSNPQDSFEVTPIDYKFKGQQNVVRMRITPVKSDTGCYYVNNITKKIHIATPIYDCNNAQFNNIVNIAETKAMVK